MPVPSIYWISVAVLLLEGEYLWDVHIAACMTVPWPCQKLVMPLNLTEVLSDLESNFHLSQEAKEALASSLQAVQVPGLQS